MNSYNSKITRSKPSIIFIIFTVAALALIIRFFIKNIVNNLEGEKLTIENVVGDVKYIRGDKETTLKNGSKVLCGGTFYVGDDSSATVVFDKDKTITLSANCIMEVTAKNSIDSGNSPEALVKDSNVTVKSYNVMISKGEANIDIKSINNNAFFKVSTPDVDFYIEASKIAIRRDEELSASYVTVERGDIEIFKGSTHNVKEGNSVYVKDGEVGRCAIITLEKKDAYLYGTIEGTIEEWYEIYSDERVGESNIYYSYSGSVVSIDDLELAQKVYDMFDEIYRRAEDGETCIEVNTPDKEKITVHIKEFENGVIVFDPIDFKGLYSAVYRL